MFAAYPINGQTWLICGGRNFADQEMFDSVMSQLLARFGCPRKVVHGGASGADAMAHKWAENLALDIVEMKADWSKGRGAGPVRNQRMLEDHAPAVVVAFPGGRGTADMVRRAHDARDHGVVLNVVEIKPTP